ncbi:MAG: hypothetical protein ACK5IJ_01585 [Mangrovibacterium sp.]
MMCTDDNSAQNSKNKNSPTIVGLFLFILNANMAALAETCEILPVFMG